MVKIRLPGGEWEYDPSAPLGPPGGFGEVFAGQGPIGSVAVKRLHISAHQAAHRELRIAEELRGKLFNHVIPVHDAGRDSQSDNYFVVMDRADSSLQSTVSNNGPLPEAEAVEVLLAIAKGLVEVDWIVHRDLKPGNVLLHNRKWKIADFGIARFVEESTSIRTLKQSLTPPYAAPEQWRLEHATPATDIYALGCISYFILTGTFPFPGPQNEDFKKQHLQEDPPRISGVDPVLVSLSLMMLRKHPEARPSIDRVIELLESIKKTFEDKNPPSGIQSLAEAGAKAATEQAKADAERARRAKEDADRRRLADEANKILNSVLDSLVDVISAAAPSAHKIDSRSDRRRVSLGTATLDTELLSSHQPIPKEAFQRSGWDVISGAVIQVEQPEPKRYVWGANLWFTNLGNKEHYRWYEVSYFITTARKAFEPHAVREFQKADLAASNISSHISMATRPIPVDDENCGEFCNRWADLLAKAYNRELQLPSRLPLDR